MSSVCLSRGCYRTKQREREREKEREGEREGGGRGRERERENFTNHKIVILLSMVCYVLYIRDFEFVV